MLACGTMHDDHSKVSDNETFLATPTVSRGAIRVYQGMDIAMSNLCPGNSERDNDDLESSIDSAGQYHGVEQWDP